MPLPFVFAALISAVVLPAGQASGQQNPILFTLPTTTTYGGLRVALPAGSGKAPKLGLALAGGGAKAASSIGVLKVLDREGIRVAAIAGTSMGAGIGSLYAAGYSPDEIERIFLATDWNDIYRDTPGRAFLTQEQKESGSRHLLTFMFHRGRFIPPSGLTAAQKLTNLWMAKTLAASFEADLDFNKLRVPFRAVATDIETGEAVVLDHGLLHEAARASAAIPAVFQPVELGGRLLVDGGLVNNLPVDVARSMGVEVVLAVDSSRKLEKRERLISAFDIMSQSISVQVRRESERQAALADLVITPDTSEYYFTDFPSIGKIIKKGEEAAEEALPRIRELLRAKAETRQEAQWFRIAGLIIRGNVSATEAEIRQAMAPVLAPLRESTSDDIHQTLTAVFNIGCFSDVSLELTRQGDTYNAILSVRENPVVKALTVNGNTIITTYELISRLKWQIGRPLNTARLSADLDAVVKQYRDRGYLLTRVERAGLMSDNSTLELALYEGRVDSIALSGGNKTQPSLIRREIRTAAGKPLNLDILAYDIQHLYALDYFESLAVNIAKSPQGGVTLTFKIKEKPTSTVRLGLRYDLEDGFTGLTDLVVDNVTGRGIKLYLNTRYGNYTDVTFGYHSPVFLRSYFVHSVQVFHRQRNYFIYEAGHKISELDITRTGAEASFGYEWFRFGDTHLRYRYTSDKTVETLGRLPVPNRDHITSLAVLSTVDTRDSGSFAHKGILLKGSYETARPPFGDGDGFVKTTVSAQGNVPIAERHTFILEASGGTSSGNIPYQDRFGIGGSDYLLGVPLLGYQRREFTGSAELGFSAAWRWKFREYQLKAVKAAYLTLTAQAANVWDSRDDISVRDLRNGGGLGLSADSLIGPIRLDVAMAEGGRKAVYFSAGFDF